MQPYVSIYTRCSAISSLTPCLCYAMMLRTVVARSSRFLSLSISTRRGITTQAFRAGPTEVPMSELKARTRTAIDISSRHFSNKQFRSIWRALCGNSATETRMSAATIRETEDQRLLNATALSRTTSTPLLRTKRLTAAPMPSPEVYRRGA